MGQRPQPQPIPLRTPPTAARGRCWLLPNTPAAMHAMAPWLTGRDRLMARRHRFPERRRAFQLASALLRFALTRYLDIAPRLLPLERRSQRRPRVRALRWAEPLSLSVAHTGKWVIAGVLPGGGRLGLDLEDAARPVSDALTRRLPWPDDLVQPSLLQRWTLVEAALKADGRGLPALGDLELTRTTDGEVTFRSGQLELRAAPLNTVPGQARIVAAVAVATPLRAAPTP